MKTTLVDIQKIHEHESTDTHNVEMVKQNIISMNCFTEPIIVDREHLVVLDGHHRLQSCKMLGFTKIPCILVDYVHDTRIRVIPRRADIPVDKLSVIHMGLSGNVFPHKTTKHVIPYRKKNLRIPLCKLK